jgi:septal ring factor EnvC (AmiA/AmiB activator)
MAETNGSGGPDRLGPIERILEAMAKRQAEMQKTQAEIQQNIAEMQDIEADIQQDIKNLVRAQVVMGDGLTKFEDGLAKLEEAQLRTEANLNALIVTVDGIIRGRKQDSQ